MNKSKSTIRRKDRTPSVHPRSTYQPNTLQADLAILESELFKWSNVPREEVLARNCFRKLLLDYTDSVGIAHLTRDTGKSWELIPENSSGRTPRRSNLDELECLAEHALQKQMMQIAQPEFLQDATLILVPVVTNKPEVLLVTIPKPLVSQNLEKIEKAGTAFRHWLQNLEGRQNEWKLNSLACVIELVTKLESAQDVQTAIETLCLELNQKLRCESVGFAISKNWRTRRTSTRLQLKAVNGAIRLDPTSETCQLIEQAFHETKVRQKPTAWPPRSEDEDYLLIAHKQLAYKLQCEAVLSQPVQFEDGRVLGYLIFSGSKERLQNERFSRFVNLVASRVGSPLALVEKTQKGPIRRLAKNIIRTIPWPARIATTLIVVAAFAMLIQPFTYQIRTDCEVAPQSRRFAIAPFDGIVEKGFAKPGDIVRKGDLLANMDSQLIDWELASTAAELAKSEKQQKIELANRNIPESILSQLERERLFSKQKTLRYQKRHIKLCSPVAGVVLSGSLERAEGASVNKGDVLFEVAPLDQLRVEIFVPSDEISYISKGCRTKIWIEGRESIPLDATISRVYPQSEIRNKKNVFRCEVLVENKNGTLKPGMKGSAKIEGPRNTLAWNLFHKPWGFMKSRMGW